ncbi:hypothetical protein NHQ30_011405 [Ciborinia camelliae]|nr:hypothetical protein NHQ30_011405 [Ciborinia camelliae]
MVNVVTLLEKIKEIALRDGDIEGEITEDEFEGHYRSYHQKVARDYPEENEEQAELRVTRALTRFYWKKKPQDLFPELYLTEAPKAAPQRKIPSVTESVAPPVPEQKTVASVNGLSEESFKVICKNNPELAAIMYHKFIAATTGAIPPAQPRTQEKPIGNTQQMEDFPAQSGPNSIEPVPTNLNSSSTSNASRSSDANRTIHVGRSYMAPPAPRSSLPPTSVNPTENERGHQEHKYKTNRSQKWSSRYHS